MLAYATTPIASAQDYLDEVRKTIRRHGWMVQYVESDRTPFAYTIGLHDWGLPELLITAVSPHRATRLSERAWPVTRCVGRR